MDLTEQIGAIHDAEKLTEKDIIWAAQVRFRVWYKCWTRAFQTMALYTSPEVRGRFESDLVCVDRSKLVHEIEVKLTIQDLKRDLKKTILTDDGRKKKHDLLQAGKLANFFWFAAPKGMVNPEDLPEYAGLLEVKKELIEGEYFLLLNEVKPAQKIHKNKVTTDVMQGLLRSMHDKLWRDLAGRQVERILYLDGSK